MYLSLALSARCTLQSLHVSCMSRWVATRFAVFALNTLLRFHAPGVHASRVDQWGLCQRPLTPVHSRCLLR